MKRHRAELIIVIVAAIVIAVLAYGREAAHNALPHSTYSSNDTGPNGYRALYEMLQSANVPVARFSRVLGVLDPHVKTLVLTTYALDLDQAQPMDSHDKALLKDFVERGGRLVVLDYDFEGENDIIPGVAKATGAKATGAIPLARDTYTAGVGKVAAPIESVFPFETRIGVPLLANDAGIVAIAYRLGKGTVIAVTSPALFSNVHLASADNARFAYNVIAGNGPVAFDEYVHGYNDGLSFWGALPLPVRAATYILGAVLLIGLIGANVPFAPTIPLDPPDERDSSAYIDAMAALMRRAHAGRAAVEAFAADGARIRRGGEPAQQARSRLERLAAIPDPSDAALVEAAVLDYRLRKDRT
ncbi:MAG TPA: DUF4350 domain-containing protein [Candidatus Acidoferrales bacterium]|nr:DUF4350 domain-containing protein [Candidatus Acidoferrales bacterium]